jgi:hypothetical protein
MQLNKKGTPCDCPNVVEIIGVAAANPINAWSGSKRMLRYFLFPVKAVFASKPFLSKKENPRLWRGCFDHQVEIIGVEPMTSCMPCKRSSQLS